MFDVWKNVLAEVEKNIPHEAFVTWFDGVKLLSTSNGVVKVGVPNVFKVRQLQTKYDKYIKEALKKNGVDFSKIEYTVQTHTTVKKRGGAEVTRIGNVVRRSSNISRVVKSFSTGLNDKYSLDNFVIGSNNELAVSAAQNIIDEPGTGRFNPFFLYGGPGLGKTHLVQAIGNELVRKDSNLKVLYTTTSDFYSEFISSIQNKKSENFSRKYRGLDVLIIDDFQMIVGKDRSQIAFFDIFNDLHQHNKQIIVTSDRLPGQLKEVDARLASRLEWTGPIDLQMPSFEERCAILKAKAEFQNLEIEDEAIEFIAENVKTNVRELEGKLNHVMLYADLKNVTPLEILKSGYATQRHMSSSKPQVSSRQILEKVAKCSDMKVEEMCSKSRVAHIKTARQIAMYLLAEELGMSTTKIAREVGVKDHTTVMHGVKKIREDLRLDFMLRERVEKIREAIYE